MRALVFVYGTLKEGFTNAPINDGDRVAGEFQTVRRFPLFVIGEYYIPWLVDQEGEGSHIQGQVFCTDTRTLRRMDELEMLDQPGWFTRRRIQVQSTLNAASAVLEAFVYFGASERLKEETVHTGPISEFNSEHDREYRKRAASPTAEPTSSSGPPHVGTDGFADSSVPARAAPMSAAAHRARWDAQSPVGDLSSQDLGFSYRQRKGGVVEVMHRGRLASTLRGADAIDFIAEVESSDSAGAQQLMARVTGNFKHGNERLAITHPRNRR